MRMFSSAGLVASMTVIYAAAAQAQAIWEPPADAQQSEEQDNTTPCVPYPSCLIIGSPYKPPPFGQGGIISADRAPGFGNDSVWNPYEFDPETNMIILHREDPLFSSPDDSTMVAPLPELRDILRDREGNL